MCFYIDSKHREVKIAKKTIKCYKILEKDGMTSPFYPIIYKKNKIIKSSIGRKQRKCYNYSIEKGLHSFSKKSIATKYRNNILFCPTIYKVIEARIPKGSKYYYNSNNHQYVSNQLKIV